MDHSQKAKLLMILRLCILTVAGGLCAAGVSYVLFDIRWEHAVRELAEFKVPANENAQKAAIRPPIPVPGKPGHFIVPFQGSPEITDADRDRLDALELKRELMNHDRDLARRFGIRSTLFLFVMVLIYSLFSKIMPNQLSQPTQASGLRG